MRGSRTPSTGRQLALRGLGHHVRAWGDAACVSPERPPLVLLHGWMDVGASFQFLVDALRTPRLVWAPDWRGFGLTGGPPGAAWRTRPSSSSTAGRR